MFDSVLNVLFGCSHRRTTFPLTPARRAGFSNSKQTGTYVVCLDCGKEFDYNWGDMRVGAPVPEAATAADTLSAVNR